MGLPGPGNPELAARYAYEDAIVIMKGRACMGRFSCALQSAAFVESDKRKLIDIALSYIPEESKTTAAIRKAMECYDNHVEFTEARKEIHNTAPGTFGVQSGTIQDIPAEGNEGMEIGAPGFDAPENVAFTIAGWLYGEEDFGKSLCMAVACGEDTDCTCATLGAVLGIIAGASGLPEKWTAPLDDKIATLCIDKTSGGIWVPSTVTELTERVMRAAPGFLGQDICDIFADGGMTIDCKEGNELYCKRTSDYIPKINGNGKDEALPVKDLCSLSPYVVRYSFPAFNIMVDYEDSIFFKSGETRKIKVTVTNSHTMRQQQWAKINVYMPSGVELLNGKGYTLPLNNLYGSKAEAEIAFNTDLYDGGRLEFVVEVSLEGRHSSGAVKVTLMREA
ncbi:MAG: ADP-ribosylglycohydrolase family protein [Eisenbergiella sp.]